MKKILTAVLALAIAASALVACGGKDASSSAQTYTDGTYRAEAYGYSHGYKEFMEVTYAGDKITNVVFDAVSEADPAKLKTTVTADEYPMKDADGNEFLPGTWYPMLAEKIKNGEEIAVAGASHSSASAKEMFAAIDAAAMAGATETIIIGAPTYVDGTYRAEAAAFSHGYKEFMEVTYAGGKITAVVFDAVSEADPAKLKTTVTADEYPMKDADGNEFLPGTWYPMLAEKVMNGEEIAVAGASHSSASGKAMAAAIDAAAQAGNTETIIMPAE